MRSRHDLTPRGLQHDMSIATFLFGKPIATEEDGHERVGALAGVAILGLDALASAAYGPEALLTVLLPLGTTGLRYLPALTGVIVLLLTILYLSYRQTIDAYPGGGGAYAVARENLGANPSLLAASALALDYILNAAVAISAGVAALASAIPPLLPYTLPLCLGALALLTLVNLRGVRESGAVFLLPTFVFVASLFAVMGLGIAKVAAGHAAPVVAPPSAPRTLATASMALLFHAFASGCTAMTGVEAVSNGVPIFRRPSTVRARQTLTMIVAILMALLAGEAFLCRAYRITATAPGTPGYQTVLSQLVGAVIGRGPLYFVALGSVAVVLLFSANTSFAGFPRLCRVLSEDRYLPEAFMHRGRRLAFGSGIIVLAALAGILLVAFGGITDALIPLFAVGALLAFTMSQAGMVAHWRTHPGRRARTSMVMNGVGAIATAVTLCIVLAAKFREGAWLTVLLMGAMLVLFKQMRRHFDFVARATATDSSLEVGPPRPPIAVVPIRRWDAVTLKGLQFAIGFAPRVVAVQVLTESCRVDDLSERWNELVTQPARAGGFEPPSLVVLRSEYRQLFAPFLAFVTKLARDHTDRSIAVIVPELVERRWYHFFLHSHTSSALKALLLYRGGPQVVVVSTPWYLRDWLPEQRRLRALRNSVLGLRRGDRLSREPQP